MDDTPNLKLPYIMASQAQKHVTHNEAIRALDAVVQLSVLDRDLTAPPGSPADGDRYLVAAGATGAWAGKQDEITAYQDNAWMFYAPREGWLVWVADEDELFVWNGSAWAQVSDSDLQNIPSLGINATADTTNRLSVSSPATLLNHEGAGHQVKINKNAAGDTASILYQAGFSGRAEIGLTGDDDFHFKVSPDGSTFHEGILIDKDNGEVSFPKDTYYGTGIYLGGLTGAKNKLDYYVGKTNWTPDLTFGPGSTGMTYATRVGTYQRHGDIMECFFDITLSAKGSSTGIARVRGLPFATSGGLLVTGLVSNFSGLTGSMAGYADTAGTWINLVDWNGNNTNTLSEANFTDTTRLMGWIKAFVS